MILHILISKLISIFSTHDVFKNQLHSVLINLDLLSNIIEILNFTKYKNSDLINIKNNINSFKEKINLLIHFSKKQDQLFLLQQIILLLSESDKSTTISKIYHLNNNNLLKILCLLINKNFIQLNESIISYIENYNDNNFKNIIKSMKIVNNKLKYPLVNTLDKILNNQALPLLDSKELQLDTSDTETSKKNIPISNKYIPQDKIYLYQTNQIYVIKKSSNEISQTLK